MGERGGRAVVVGGSIAGLLAARVLADLFDTVVLIERDRLPSNSVHRRGVPQGKQIHALLSGGQRVLDDLLPGLTAELAAGGAPVVDALADLRLSFNGHRLRQGESGLVHVSASRPLLEHHIRRRTLSMPNVSLVDGCEVVGLVGHGDRVDGVRVVRRGRRVEQELADVVVDACGRGSRTSVWLTELGCPSPPVDRIPIDLGYSTRRFHLPADVFGGDVGVLHSPTPARPRGAALSLLENDIWMLTLVGVLGDHPPADPGGFSAFAATVDCDDIQKAIRHGRPIDDPVSFRFPASVRHRYEQVWLPGNLVVLGDSLCSFNPVYGQGMTVAALEARALAARLRRNRDTSSTTVMADLARIVDVPWNLANSADRPFLDPAAMGRPRKTPLDWYVDRVLSTATHDPAAGRAFLAVTGLREPPQALLKPDLIRRTLRNPPTAMSAVPTPSQPTDADPRRVQSPSPWWLFGIIGAAALMKPVLVLTGLAAAAKLLRAVQRRHRSSPRPQRPALLD